MIFSGSSKSWRKTCCKRSAKDAVPAFPSKYGFHPKEHRKKNKDGYLFAMLYLDLRRIFVGLKLNPQPVWLRHETP